MCFYKMEMNLSRFRPPLFSAIIYEYVSYLYIFYIYRKKHRAKQSCKKYKE